MILYCSANGFGSLIAFEDFKQEDIVNTENFVRLQLGELLQKICEINGKLFDDDIKRSYFGDFGDSTKDFRYSDEERQLISKCAQYVTYLSRIEEINTEFGHFQLDDNDLASETATKEDVAPNSINCVSQSHYFLNLLLAEANKNVERPKEGYRFTEKIKKMASYYRLVAGPYAYESLQRNLELCLPTLSSVNRYVRKMNTGIVEGVLRQHELLTYLKNRNLPMTVALSEDATRLTGVVQYDAKTNQLMGFVLPIHSGTGMPIPYSFSARNAGEMIKHFANKNVPGNFVNVIMAQPLADVAPFCLLLFASDNQYTSVDVSNRWNYISKELNAVGIKVLVISSDSDPKYNSAMRRCSLLGSKSFTFADSNMFMCGDGNLKEPFFVQDTVHISTKLRNRMLKTKDKPKMLPFGNKYFISMDHLRHLLENFPKDQHELTPSVLNPIDRMNFASVNRMCSPKVTDLLTKHVKNSVGTVWFLEMIRDVIDSYRDKKLAPLQRIQKIWYALFVLRLWREYILSKRHLTIEENFLSHNCYSCIELNAHMIVLIILFLKEKDMPHLFRPEFYESQPCEMTFSELRSFTPTFSTVINVGVKEVVNRIGKAQLLSDIAFSCTDFKFPRVKTYTEDIKDREVHILPSKSDICFEIEKCRIKAITFANKIGLCNSKDVNGSVDCGIKMLPIQNNVQRKEEDDEWIDFDDYAEEPVPIMGHITLTDYSDKFLDTPDENSIYVEVFCGSNLNRKVIKKSSLCWLLREDMRKLSNDRLQRVRTGLRKKKQKIKSLKNVSQNQRNKFNIQKKKRTIKLLG